MFASVRKGGGPCLLCKEPQSIAKQPLCYLSMMRKRRINLEYPEKSSLGNMQSPKSGSCNLENTLLNENPAEMFLCRRNQVADTVLQNLSMDTPSTTRLSMTLFSSLLKNYSQPGSIELFALLARLYNFDRTTQEGLLDCFQAFPDLDLYQ